MRLCTAFWGLPLLLCVTSCAPISESHSAFVGRNGRTFSLKINGTEAVSTPEKDWLDTNGVNSEQTEWSVGPTSGNLCLTVAPQTDLFGEFVQAELIIREYRSDRPYISWKQYGTEPRPSEGHPPVPNWIPGKAFCPREFFLTPRLRYKALPAGEYIVAVRYYGRNNWDKKSVHVVVK